jgi:hypothetical protein
MRTLLSCFALIALASSGLCAAGPALDLVLVLQNSSRMAPYLDRTELSGLDAGDRVALVLFSGKPSLKVKFTEDAAKASAAVPRQKSQTKFRLAGMPPPGPGKCRVWDALVYAAGLFRGDPDPARRRAVVVLFGDEDTSSKMTPADVKNALGQAHAILAAAAVGALLPMSKAPRIAGTPPTFPGISVYRLPAGPVPDATLGEVKLLSAGTGGSVWRGVWDLPEAIRSLKD